eukprot:scaffold8803_cov101-Isochrysis_galbana.AAC.1
MRAAAPCGGRTGTEMPLIKRHLWFAPADVPSARPPPTEVPVLGGRRVGQAILVGQSARVSPAVNPHAAAPPCRG